MSEEQKFHDKITEFWRSEASNSATAFYDRISDALNLGAAATRKSIEGDLEELARPHLGGGKVKLAQCVYMCMAINKSPALINAPAAGVWFKENAALIKEMTNA